ncbi:MULTISPECIES: 50S ribosomal protein L4 [Desulfurella]|jgi:large subunit ribosomal protein L4|uniref:Large ribosomal subunit protein uL4 n=1 Tax=Desulfurella multipotens TaxID=79269 RepID=A0A1G6KFP2_9BACT|nr:MULTISPECIES: 50S ribosomal protein L4 [Desulfurella]AHF96688.1 50S ribosomal protein L4 [Desulfurella acetivorans A63]HEX13989.1 50S ribosomal protein L4 [Desulfurella acetivorans]PMP67911.1 MAG: 50S ribosomal protein L4 [Desulfurella multipotens]PMP87078.1 MAG: 50S ribosomal protein L4 [Desulfurella sp.]SDC29830.1 large subunit ribosomal protein L4 [Desulfurella multipotens]
MKIEYFDKDVNRLGEIDFNLNFKPSSKPDIMLNRVIRVLLANKRQWTASTKTRSEVSGGGKKPWKQKGTGRARAGSIRSPLFRGGGVIFGPKPKLDFELKINKKEKRKAFLEALIDHIEAKTLILLNDLDFGQPKTKVAFELVKKLNADKSLFILDKNMTNAYLSLRNLKSVEIRNVDTVNVYDIMRFPKVVTTKDIFEKLSRRFANG